MAAIGSKLGKDALLDSILSPSATIAHEYVTWILAVDTPQRVVVKTENGEAIRLKPGEITGRQLADVLEFLTTLKDEKRAAR